MNDAKRQINHGVRPRAALTRRKLGFAALLAALAAAAPAQAGETVLHSFIPNPFGANPFASVCAGPSGKFYGTTAFGGSAGQGVLFYVDRSGRETLLHSFTGGSDGGFPQANVLCDSAGNVYGTTAGGASGAGVVFEMHGTGLQTVLYSFTGGADGGYPLAGVILDSAGNLYGTTNGGGSAGAGVVFKLDSKGHETVLYSFTGGNDGANPYGGLIRDSAGNLYGTTAFGGSAGAGLVFKLDSAGHETVLYTFTGGTDGGIPTAGVIQDSAGNLYGTATGGGAAGAGVVYKLNTANQETVLYSFTGGNDGNYPYAGVIRDSAGNLYGAAEFGGSAGFGVVFKVNASNQETVLYTFTGKADGAYPSATPIIDSAGNLYATSGGGGPAQAGVLYKIDTTGHETVLYGFPGIDGNAPWAGLVRDAAGNLYGATTGGGSAGAGVVYKLDPTGHETILYNFTGGADGANPSANVILDSAGNLYGTANGGGSAGAGVVYKLDTSGHETVLYSFKGICCGFPTTDGSDPNAGLTMDSVGNLYGTTYFGGTAGWGTVFKLDPSGNETILYNFTNGPDGGQVASGVTMDSAGNLYGTTFGGGHSIYGGQGGVVYKLDPSGHETVLYDFCSQLSCLDGAAPWAGVVLDSAGNLYGTTWSGGPAATGDPGVVYKVDPTGHETVVYPFVGTSDGNTPRGGVILDSSGNLYGTTEFGGPGSSLPYGSGVVFEVDTTGHETILYSFTGGADGGVPETGVIRDAAGNLYGTTVTGGAAGAGVVYKITAGSSAPTDLVNTSLQRVSAVPGMRPTDHDACSLEQKLAAPSKCIALRWQPAFLPRVERYH